MILDALFEWLVIFITWFITILAIGLGIIISLKLFDLILGLPQWLNG